MKRLSSEINKIKALIIEDFSNGEIKTYYNKYDFEELLNKYTENEITKVFEITDKKRQEILSVIIKNMNLEDKGVKIDIDGMEMFTKVFPIVTDMDFNMDLKEDYEYLLELVNNPTEWMEEVLNVVVPRLTKLTKTLIKDVDKFNSLPKNKQEEIVNQGAKLISELQLEDVTNDLNKLKDNVDNIKGEK